MAALSIWIGIAIWTRSSDPRTAAQLSALASLPFFVVATVIAVGGLHVTVGPVVAIGAALVLIDALGWKIVTPISTANGSSPQAGDCSSGRSDYVGS